MSSHSCSDPHASPSDMYVLVVFIFVILELVENEACCDVMISSRCKLGQNIKSLTPDVKLLTLPLFDQ